MTFRGTAGSLKGLLELLDGSSGDGRTTIVTCNDREKLHDVMVRPGRIDREIKFSLLSKSNATPIFTRIYGQVLEPMGEKAKSMTAR